MTTMQRSEFGNWGLGLDDHQFAYAIASIGICGGLLRNWPISGDATSIASDLAKWVNFREPLPFKFFIERPEEWSKFPYIPSAVSLAGTWEIFEKTLPYNPRFILEFDSITQHDLESIKWLQQQLLIAVGMKGAPSFYQPLVSFVKYVNWQWPIRIGFFTDEKSRYLMDQLSSKRTSIDWMNKLSKAIDLSLSNVESVDILIVPGGIQNTLEIIRNAPHSIYANSIGIIGGSEYQGDNFLELIQKITQLTQASAIFVATPNNFGEWITYFIRELSHDEPFDIALAQSRTLLNVPQTVLWATPELLASSSISNYGMNLLDNPVLKTRLSERIMVPERLRQGIRLDPGIYSFEEIKNRIKEVGWFSEEGGASMTIAIEELIRQVLKDTHSKLLSPQLKWEKTQEPFSIEEMLYNEAQRARRKKVKRFLQAEVRANGNIINKAFYRNKENTILIHIGPLELGKIGLSEQFPNKELPATTASGHMLTVVFFEPNLMERPEIAGLFLPKSGRSEPCNFKLFISENAKRVEVRVQVLYKNRILQSGILSGLVTDYYKHMPLHIGEKERITFISHHVSAAHMDLDNRSRFDASFLLNHNGETPGFYRNSNNRSVYVRLDSVPINEHIKQVEKILDRSDWDKPKFNGLTAEGTTNLLRDLAWAGSSLYQILIEPDNQGFANETAPLKGVPQKIQVVCANVKTYMPFEFIYDFAAPDDNAGICPKASEALLNGKCENCPSKDEDPAQVICPLGFWCMSRIIEWHAFTEKLAKSTLNAPFKLKMDNSEDLAQLKFMMNPLVGYSNKVTKAQPTSIVDLQNSFNKIGIPSPIIVNTWDKWKENIDHFNPTLEVLLIHTEKKGPRTMIEIGDDTISTLNLKKYFTDKEIWPSIVLLFGCGTGTSVVQFQSVAALVENRASIVVSTTSDVFGPLASRLAGYFIERLGELNNLQSFGDVMLSIRRKALANGVPMVLCLRTYGDADWILTK